MHQTAFGITFGGIFLKLFFKNIIKKINLKKYIFILLYQGLCKRFQNIYNFQNLKFVYKFVSAKKHTLQCLMNVFESVLLIMSFKN